MDRKWTEQLLFVIFYKFDAEFLSYKLHITKRVFQVEMNFWLIICNYLDEKKSFKGYT